MWSDALLLDLLRTAVVLALLALMAAPVLARVFERSIAHRVPGRRGRKRSVPAGTLRAGP